ncbi:nodal modulator 1 [Cocos nucifera]|uniref:Nodal modulator 1 n=1 Tax=Cocos nucifera TaxID=13894 RepID=A0A8K0I7E8_COCNU|nr:nodal modulator 1 [Cocos nucifera]
MAISNLFLFLLIALFVSSTAADAIHGCGGFVEASSSLIKSRKASDTKLDYSDITVELCTVDGLVKDRTQCAPNGYYFIPVYDKGSFIVRVKGPDGWSFEPDTVPVIIDQNGCNANADINFRFTGFMISGRVKGAVGGESCSLKDGGPSGVAVELLSPSDDVIASVLTSATGDYSFTNVIPGKYKLQASHPNLEIEVRGSPEVNLGFGNIMVDDIFFVLGYDLHGFVVAQIKQSCSFSPLLHEALPCNSFTERPSMVTGFSVGGHVVDGIGAGVDNATVIVDGQLRAITDSQGYYMLDQVCIFGTRNHTNMLPIRYEMVNMLWFGMYPVTSKHYSIGAEKAHYKFNTLENFLVMPNMVSIDNIKAVYYDICGVVQMITATSKAMVTLTHGPDNVKPQKKLVDENGNFCFEVPAGDYRLSALGVDSASTSGLLFSPPYVDVKVNRPVLNVEFFQALVEIHGSVLCKENCNQNVSVSLVRLVDAGIQETRTIALTHESGDFMFHKVFPGRYQLEVKHISSPAMPEEDNWCWDRSAIDLDVGAEDVTGIVFVQKGYWISIISTHDTDAYIQQSDSSRVDFSIRRGSQKVCVESPGQHELHFVNPCIFFGSSSLTFDTLNPVPIYLTGKKYLLKGEVHMDLALNRDAVDLSEHIVVDIFNRDGVLLDTISTKFAPDINDQRAVAVYEYSIWSNLGEEFIFAPRDSRTSIGKKILFYPRQRLVSVTIDGCQAPIPPVVGQVGLYLEGSVSPALAGVNIRILAAGESSYAPLQKGDLAFETETGPDGSFTAGPLYSDTTYNIEASKPGYHVRKVGSNSFTCQKLGQIVVNIYDGAEAGELLPSVLLSLSGEDGYRNNSVSSAGGTFVFDNLFPGSFYLRPLLKEYAFSPSAVAIELDSGESKVIDFYATRVAYSAMGSVSLLAGQPKEGVYVEARSESKGYYEEATTDSLGNFRLRGLLPDTTYLVKVVAKDYLRVTAVERASPDSVVIKVGSEDIRGLDFVVFEQPERTILSGHVEGSDLEVLQPHLSVEVRLAADPSKIETVFPLPLSYFFQIHDLPKGKHLVQLRSGLPSSTHKFESDIFEVDLKKQPQIHVGPLRFKVEEYYHKQVVPI